MKTLFLSFTFLITWYAGASHDRKDEIIPATVQVTQTKDHVFELHYMRQSSRMVQVKIRNSENVIVYSERLKKGRFIRPYNLANLPEGIYTLEVLDENGMYRHIISNRKKMSTSFSYVKFNPVTPDQVKLTIFTQEEREVSIRVYDESSQLLHSAKVFIIGAYVRLYTLKEITGGYISVQVGDTFELYSF